MDYYSNLPEFGFLAPPAKVFKVNWWIVGGLIALVGFFCYLHYDRLAAFFSKSKQAEAKQNQFKSHIP